MRRVSYVPMGRSVEPAFTSTLGLLFSVKPALRNCVRNWRV